MWAYSISILVSNEVEPQWIDWMKQFYIPEIKETNCFQKILFSKIHHSTPSEDANNYNITLQTKDKNLINTFHQEYELTLREQAQVLFQDKILFFSTELEYISF